MSAQRAPAELVDLLLDYDALLQTRIDSLKTRVSHETLLLEPILDRSERPSHLLRAVSRESSSPFDELRVNIEKQFDTVCRKMQDAMAATPVESDAASYLTQLESARAAFAAERQHFLRLVGDDADAAAKRCFQQCQQTLAECDIEAHRGVCLCDGCLQECLLHLKRHLRDRERFPERDSVVRAPTMGGSSLRDSLVMQCESERQKQQLLMQRLLFAQERAVCLQLKVARSRVITEIQNCLGDALALDANSFIDDAARGVHRAVVLHAATKELVSFVNRLTDTTQDAVSLLCGLQHCVVG